MDDPEQRAALNSGLDPEGYGAFRERSAFLPHPVPDLHARNGRDGLRPADRRHPNPATGDVDGTPTGGFLPPDDAAGDGEGYVSFQVDAGTGDTTGTTIDASASIVFDKNS